MEKARLFDIDPVSQSRTLFQYDGSNDTFTIVEQQEEESLLVKLQNMRNAFSQKLSKRFKGDMHLMAQIPEVTYWDLKRRGIMETPATFRKWLNDRDNEKYRARPGSV
jgi:hypothetical protein